MKEFVEAAPKWIGVGSFVVLVLTVVHEYGYFFVIGSHFQTVISTYDYFTNSLVWLPSTLAILSYVQVMEGILQKPAVGPVRVFGILFYVQLAFALLLFVVTFFVGGSMAFEFTLIFGFMSVWGMSKVLRTENFENRWGLYKTIAMTPMVLIFAFGYGASSAYSDLKKTDDVYVVKTDDGDKTPTGLVMLRGLEKGILVRNYEKETVQLIRWEQIISISKFASRKTDPSLSCQWLGIFCRHPETSPYN